MSGAGLPHSGIRGSLAIQRLTAAYRSRSRPSSTLGAKASTMCPYYLDGDLGRSQLAPPGDTRVIGYCAVFKVRVEAHRTDCPAGLSKLNSMRAASPAQAPACDLSGPVDISSGRSRSSRASRADGEDDPPEPPGPTMLRRPAPC